MRFTLKKFLRLIPSCFPRRDGKEGNGSIPLGQRDGNGPAPNTVLKPVEVEFSEERAKVEAKAFAEAKRNLEDEVRELKGLLEEREKVVGQRDADIQQLRKERDEMQTKLAEPRTADARVQELSTQLSEKDKLLSERTAELSAAQAFLTKVDAVSEAEVVRLIENLNTLISSASGSLSDALDQQTPVPGALTEEPDLGRIRDYFGNLMFEQIAARNSVAVTLAVQMYLVKFVEGVTSGWGGGGAAGTLGEIYERIFTKEGQTIASRWRTLTRRYVSRQEPPRDEEIIKDLARILMITRSFSSFSEAVESVGNNARTEVNSIIKATLNLEDIIKTKISSSDIFVYVVPPGAAFSEGVMENEFGKDGTREEGGIVAGTMEIGLFQRVGNVEKALKKPKVILERDLPEPESEGEK